MQFMIMVLQSMETNSASLLLIKSGNSQMQGQQMHQVLQPSPEEYVTFLAIQTLMIGVRLIKKVAGGVLPRVFIIQAYIGQYSTMAKE